MNIHDGGGDFSLFSGGHLFAMEDEMAYLAKWRVVAALVMSVLLPLSAQAAFVVPDTVTASSAFSSDFAPDHTIDGSGLTIGYDATSTHAPYAAGNHWTTADWALPLNSWIEWQFAAGQSLDSIHLWNHQSTVPPGSDTLYDVTLFDLIIYNSSNVMTLMLNDVALLPDQSGAQTIGFGGVLTDVSRVRFEIEAIQRGSNSGYTGLAEVGFNAASAVAAPAPAGAIWILPALVLILRGLRRKA